MPFEEAQRATQGSQTCRFYTETLEESRRFQEDYGRRLTIIKAGDMPWEDCPQGRIKHLVNERMHSREFCLDLYQQLLPPGGHSGRHRHLAEEVLFVLEGSGHDLHWDVEFDCQERYIWRWAETPSRHEWEEGDFIYIPPYTMHQHVNGNPSAPARLISATSRIVRAMGLGRIEQVEEAPPFPPVR